MTQAIDWAAKHSGPWQSAIMGAVLGLDAVGLCLALATICFSGPLVQALGLATALFLLGSIVSTIILYRFSGFRVSLAISQDTTISILAPAVIMAGAAANGSTDAKVATALAVIGTSAITSGLVFWIVGWLGLGRLVRMFPYPVSAGFLASSGYLLVFAALSILTGQKDWQAMALAAGEPAVQLTLLPALAMAAAMAIAMRIWHGTFPVLLVVFVFVIGFYFLSYAFGLDFAEAKALGLLPNIKAAAETDFGFALIGLIDWPVVLQTTPVILAVVLLNLIGMLLNTSGVELATNSDVDENRELRITGLSNLLIGMFGGLTSYLQGGASIIAAKMGVQRQALIFGHFATLLLACALAPLMVAVVPTFVPAALLIFIGLSMFEDWLIGTFKRLMVLDWLIVVCIVLATAFFGILSAIAIGIALALFGFAFALIRLPIVRHSSTAAIRRSIRDRNPLQSESLLREGHRIQILHLHGTLFFGSVAQLSDRLRTIAQSQRDVRAVIIDFSDVHSFDSSACAALDKLSHVMAAHSIIVHMSSVSQGLRTMLQKWGLPLVESGHKKQKLSFHLWRNLDEALDYCETELLTEFSQKFENEDIETYLFELGRRHPRSADLLALMKHRKLVQGEVLIQANEKAADVFVLVTGRLGVHLPSSNGTSILVRLLGHGAIVGEIGYLTGQPRNAHVISEGDATVLCLSEVTLRRLEKKDRDLAALIMSIFSRSLAAKLAQNNQLIGYAQSVASALKN